MPTPTDALPEIPLDLIQVKEPCTVPWDSMRGTGEVRFCGQCRMNVYDLSEMTRGEAESLLRARGERLCVKFTRRADGTVVSADCGPVRRAIRRRARIVRVAAAGLLAMFFPAAAGGCGGPAGSPAAPAPVPSAEPPSIQGEAVSQMLGRVCAPAPAPAQSPPPAAGDGR